jgi:hypothetical protein
MSCKVQQRSTMSSLRLPVVTTWYFLRRLRSPAPPKTNL